MQITNARSLHTFTLSSDAGPIWLWINSVIHIHSLSRDTFADFFVRKRYSCLVSALGFTNHNALLIPLSADHFVYHSNITFPFRNFWRPQRSLPALYNLDLQAEKPNLLQCRQTTVSTLHLLPRPRASRMDSPVSATLFTLLDGTPSIWLSLSPTIEQLPTLRETSLLGHCHLWLETRARKALLVEIVSHVFERASLSMLKARQARCKRLTLGSPNGQLPHVLPR